MYDQALSTLQERKTLPAVAEVACMIHDLETVLWELSLQFRDGSVMPSDAFLRLLRRNGLDIVRHDP